MSTDDQSESEIKSMRHRRVLDIAADRPDASFAEIAAEVPSATADLVEQVLENYGDPAEEDTDTDEQTDSDDDSDGSDVPPASDMTDTSDADEEAQSPDIEEDPAFALTPTQIETLRTIANNPTASQRELAEELGVSGPTVCRRVNNISGFEWDNRREFVDRFFDKSETIEAPQTDKDMPPESTQDRLEAIDDRLTAIEDQLSSGGTNHPDQSLFNDPDFIHRLLRVCIESDSISEDEELRLIATLLE